MSPRKAGARGLDAGAARRIALAQPDAIEAAHMGHPDFRVRGKIFATLTADGRAMCLQVEPGNLDALVAADPRAYRAIWNGRYLQVELAHASRAALEALVADSWALVAGKRKVAARRAVTPRRGAAGPSPRAAAAPSSARRRGGRSRR